MTSRTSGPVFRAAAACAVGLVVLVALAVPSGVAQAQAVGQQRIGTTTGSFLKIGIGARAVGMGGAFVAVANDPSAIYWNPAGLASIVRREASISHVAWPADVTYDHLTYIAPVKKLGGSVGIQLGVLSTTIEETTEERPFGTGITYGYADWQAGVTYSARLTDRLLVGLGAKYVHQDLGADVGGTSANNVLVDLGTIYYLGISSVRIGMTMAHFGPDFSPGGSFLSPNNGEVREYDSFSPPTTFRFGLAWEPIERENHRLTTTIEFDQPSDNQFDTRAGFEYEWNRQVAVRSGYDINASELKWSAGAGFYPEFGSVRGTLDYAYTAAGALGAIHRVSLGGRF